jgi:predicted RNase H-like HicB family nuclease
VTCGLTVEEAREMLLDAAREMIASYRDEGRYDGVSPAASTP